jgi:hypothetical protein
MPNDRMRAVTLVIAPLMAGAVLLWFQPYSVVSPYQSYVDPARRFLHAALDRDTVGLERQAVDRQPVQWALEAGAGDAHALAIWAQSSRPYSGHRHGGTTTVVFQTSTRVCYLRPVTMAFVPDPTGPRLVHASSSCFAGQ